MSSEFEALADLIPRGSSDAICRVVREHPDVAHQSLEGGDTLLCLASWAKRIDIVECLLAAGADVNARGDRGKTPLHYAVYEGDLESLPVVRALLAHGADCSAADVFGYTLEDLAKIEMIDGLPEVLSLLAPETMGRDARLRATRAARSRSAS